MIAATDTAPAGSTTSLARSSRTRSARAISSSDTVTIWSTNSCTRGKVISPGRYTAIPSAMVGTTATCYGDPARNNSTLLRRSCSKRGHKRGRIRRLHTDDVNGSTQLRGTLLHDARNTGDETAAADRNDNGCDVRNLLENFQPDSPLTSDDVEMVERRNDDRTG